jgi:hypothetical protein
LSQQTITDTPAPSGSGDRPKAAGTPAKAPTSLWYRWHLGGLLAEIVLSVLFTWPLVLNFLPGSGTMVPGFMREDRDQNLWNLWWVRHAILGGHNPFVTDMIWYPTPVTLYYHTLAVFNGILATPLMFVFSLATTYNIIVLFSFIMTGYGAFLLIHYVCGNRWAALVGSVVFAYSAYHVGTMRSLLQLVTLEWVPFFILFFLIAVFSPSWQSRAGFVRWLWQRALPAAFFLFLVSLVDWYYTMYSLMVAGLAALYLLLRYALERARHESPPAFWPAVAEPWAKSSICIAIYLVLISPILIPMVREVGGTTFVLPAPDEALRHSADLFAFLEPMRGQQLWGRLFLNRDFWPYGSERYEVYFTYTALILGAIALFATRLLRPRVRFGMASSWTPEPENAAVVGADGRPEEIVEAAAGRSDVPALPSKWFWAGIVLIFFLLALGPVLQINGKQIPWLFSPNFPLSMPYRLIENLPIFNISRSPDRFDMPLTLGLAVLAGYGINVLALRWKARRVRPLQRLARREAVLSIGAVALIALELFPFPYPQLTADVPRWYYQLAQEPGDFSILELPPQSDFWHGAYRMYFQTVHGKEIFGGYLSREYPHPFLLSTPGYQELTYVDGSSDMFSVSRDVWLSALQKYNTRYIVLYKNRLPHRVDPPVDVSSSLDAIKMVLGPNAKPAYEDDELQAYRVPPPSQNVPFMTVGDGWEPREVGPNGSFRWMHDTATLQIQAPEAETSYLTFKATALGQPKPLQIYHGDQLVFSDTVSALKTYTTTGLLGIPRGVSTLTFRSPDGTISPSELGLGNDPRKLSFAILDAKLVPQP